jgi:hypothetical protein
MDRTISEVARRYREATDVPREEIWQGVATGLRQPASWRDAPAWLHRGIATVLVATGALIAVGVESVVRHAPAAPRLGVLAPTVSNHLARSDSLLVAFRLAAATARADSTFAIRARDLTRRTRLLEEVLPMDDSRLRALLADLDLLLTQISQYVEYPRASNAERALIEDAMVSLDIDAKLAAARRRIAGMGS